MLVTSPSPCTAQEGFLDHAPTLVCDLSSGMLRLQLGATQKAVRRALVQARSALNKPLGTESPVAAFNLWRLWASQQVVALRNLISEDDLNRLITTRLYWSLLSANSDHIDRASLLTTVKDELMARDLALYDELSAFDRDVTSWGAGNALVLVPDTSVFIEMGDTFTEVDWHARLKVRPHIPIYLVVTMAALVELDGKKLSKDTSAHGNLVRTQVRAALRRIEELFPANQDRTTFEHTHLTGGGATIATFVYTALLTDPLAHVPLESADAEMIRRGLDLVPYAGRGMLVSYDLNQTFRARAAGLESTRLRYGYETGKPRPAS